MPKFAKVDAAIAAGAEPTTIARSGRLVLKTATGSIGLADARGKLTAAGTHFYAKTGRTKPSTLGYDPNTPLAKDGAREFIVKRDGTRKLARTWDVGKGDFKYTAAGRGYFQGVHEEYIIHI